MKYRINTFKRLLLIIAIAVTTLLFTGGFASEIPENSTYIDNLASGEANCRYPFSFMLACVGSNNLLATCEIRTQSRKLDTNRTKTINFSRSEMER